MKGLVWLHLSDWHQKGKEFDREVVSHALLNDIERRKEISPDLAEIEFIIFSGDVAYSGKSEEYEAAIEQLFDPILNICNISSERLFIVPGNHDLNWDDFELLPETLNVHLDSSAKVEYWLTQDRQRERLLDPFRAFSSFVSDYTGQDKPDYANIRKWQICNKKISILGLNSQLSTRVGCVDARIDLEL